MVGEDEFFDTSLFEKGLTLYHSPLENNLVVTIINGSDHSAAYKGILLNLSIVTLLSKSQRLHSTNRLFGFVIDNAVGRLTDVLECNYDHSLNYALEIFEKEPAEQGGVSYRGLLSKNKSWLFLHIYQQVNLWISRCVVRK